MDCHKSIWLRKGKVEERKSWKAIYKNKGRQWIGKKSNCWAQENGLADKENGERRKAARETSKQRKDKTTCYA